MSVRRRSEAEQFLIDSISLEEYWNTRVVSLFKKATPLNKDRLSSVCPFHGDSNPSLRYYPKTKSFYCYGCGAGGSVVSLHYEVLKHHPVNPKVLSKGEVMRDLANLYGLELPNVSLTPEQLEELASNRDYLVYLEKHKAEMAQQKLSSLSDFRDVNRGLVDAFKQDRDLDKFVLDCDLVDTRVSCLV